MKIDKITLHNFKGFEGTVTISDLTRDLTPEKPIILIGGLNGAGKTTLLEAILLCLYGERNKNLWPTKGAKREQYKSWIVSVANNRAKKSQPFVKIWIELDLIDVMIDGIYESITIKRSWEISDIQKQDFQEDFKVENKVKSYVYEDFSGMQNDAVWYGFLEQGIMPYEISQFFLFDGEKIQDLVRDEDKEFEESLKKALQLSLYEQLIDDIKTVRSQILTEYNKKKSTSDDIKRTEDEITVIKRDIEEQEGLIGDFQSKIEEIDEEIKKIDYETTRIGGVTEASVELVRTEEERLNQEKGRIEERIIRVIQNDLPFIITASVCQELDQQLDAEKLLQELEDTKATLKLKVRLIIQQLFEGEESVPPLISTQREFYDKKLDKILIEEFLSEKPQALNDVTPIHNLSRSDAERLRGHIQDTRDIIQKLEEDVRRLAQVERDLEDKKKSIKKSSSDEIQQFFQKKGRLDQERTQKLNEIENCKARIQKLKKDIENKQNKITKYEEYAEIVKEQKEQLAYCDQLKEALKAFLSEFQARKIKKLTEYIIEMWKILAHKKGQVCWIKIDHDNFTIKLYDSEKSELDKTKISSGEKEVFAIALIWALKSIANRDLPVVIDTPLARLDTKHREHITKHFFPKAAGQVILLSTDTEIVGEGYRAIENYVCRRLLISKSNAVEKAVIKEGYFEEL